MDEMISRRAVLAALTASAAASAARVALPFDLSASAQTPLATTDKLTDRFAPADPGAVRLDGFLGERCRKNEKARLLAKSEDELLAGFRQRPGKQAWVGEHVGKWLHAATLAWSYTHDPELKPKLDRVAAQLIATQQPDGYLGTYADGAHFAMGKEQQWDVWVHKYDLLGLLTYAQYTGNTAALDASRRIGDLLIKTFGPGGALNLNERSTHVGMASGSVLEPMVLLYRATQDERYLDFARFIVERWEAEGGPKLMSALAAPNSSVKATANAKAYEMLSCLVGLCELARATGESKYLVAPVNAWRDITANQLLLTGSGSSREHWTANRDFLSNVKDNIAETCVTVTWLQLNQQLLRLTGDARYADELEKTVYNHLAAAQRPDGAAWDYFTALNGRKPYTAEQNCCTSSGPRGWALLPTFAYLTSADGIVVNFFTPGAAQLKVNGETVTVRMQTGYPVDGRITLSVTVPKPMKFAVRVRVPAWSGLLGIKAKAGDYWLLRQTWSRTQTITLDFTLPVRVIDGQGSGAGQVAVVRGPQVLAVDQTYNPDVELNAIALISKQPQLRASTTYRDPDGLPVYEVESIAVRDTGKFRAGDRVMLRLIPFASAGAAGRDFSVWLPRGNGTA